MIFGILGLVLFLLIFLLYRLQKVNKEHFQVRSLQEIELLIAPLKESLARLDEQQVRLERQREGSHVALSTQIHALLQSEASLRKEASELAKALKSPNIRGSWGQLHLRRVVELAGLSPHADFAEQQTARTLDGVVRPDLIIHLPQERQIVIDAKTPLDAFHEAMLASDERMRKEKLLLHVQQIKKQIKELSSKEYWKAFACAPDYVILFLPSEAFFSAAVEVDSSIIEEGALQNVMIATPTTLIAILRSISFVWKQDSLSKNAKQVAQLGGEVYERLLAMQGHFMKLGKSLSTAIESYNHAMSSMESRVLVSARKLKEMGVARGDKEIAELSSIDQDLQE